VTVYEPRGSDSATFSSPSEADMTSIYSGLQSSTRDPPPVTTPYTPLPIHDYVNGTPLATAPSQLTSLRLQNSKHHFPYSPFFPTGLPYVHPCVPIIPLVPSDSPTLIFSLLRLSAHHLALAASALQPLTSGTLSLYLSVPVTVLVTSVIASRPTTASRPSTPLNPSPLVPQIRLC